MLTHGQGNAAQASATLELCLAASASRPQLQTPYLLSSVLAAFKVGTHLARSLALPLACTQGELARRRAQWASQTWGPGSRSAETREARRQALVKHVRLRRQQEEAEEEEEEAAQMGGVEDASAGAGVAVGDEPMGHLADAALELMRR